MSGLPTGTVLGRLRIDEVFFAYDGPQLFSARNTTGQRYISVAVADEDRAAVAVYLPVTASRYLATRSGLVSLREAFVEPEGDLFVVRSRYKSDEHEVETIDPGAIPDDWLPEADAFLSLPTQTQDQFDPDGLREQADSELRMLLALRLDRPDLMRTEYPLRDLKDLLEDVQETVHAVGAEEEGRATTTGAIPESIIRDSELSLVDVEAASFVVVLAPTLGDRMIEMPLATTATDRLLSLIDAAQDPEMLREAVSGLHQRAFSKFRSLLEDLADTTASLKLYMANPGKELRETGVTAQDANRGLAIMSEVSTTQTQVYVESGILIGANLRTRAFELVDDATGERYAGKVEQDALRQIDGLQLGEPYRYSARILVEERYGSASSEPKAVHRLQMVRRAGSPHAPASGHTE